MRQLNIVYVRRDKLIITYLRFVHLEFMMFNKITFKIILLYRYVYNKQSLNVFIISIFNLCILNLIIFLIIFKFF